MSQHDDQLRAIIVAMKEAERRGDLARVHTLNRQVDALRLKKAGSSRLPDGV